MDSHEMEIISLETIWMEATSMETLAMKTTFINRNFTHYRKGNYITYWKIYQYFHYNNSKIIMFLLLIIKCH